MAGNALNSAINMCFEYCHGTGRVRFDPCLQLVDDDSFYCGWPFPLVVGEKRSF
jgi:hypothetical protein